MPQGKLSIPNQTIAAATAKAIKQVQGWVAQAKLPPTELDRSIKLAVWNIREFGNSKRTDLAIHCIAEIISNFDILCLVELREDLTDLSRVMEKLGPSWDVVYSDAIEDKGGNEERIGFIFDTRAVNFTGFAGNQYQWRSKKKTEWLSENSFWRAPFGAGFSTANYDFVVYGVHARWGSDGPSRENEIQRFAELIEFKVKREKALDRDVFLVGDFNTATKSMLASLTSGLLQSAPPISNFSALTTNVKQTERYDHILYNPDRKTKFGRGGVIPFSKAELEKLITTKPTRKDADWRTYHISDHLPLWVQVFVDRDTSVLDQVISGKRKHYSATA